jgi:hypothetical protein
VRSARSLYRVALGIGGVATLALAVAALVAMRSVQFNRLDWQAIVEACRELLMSEATLASAAVVGLAGVAVATLALAVRAVVRHRRDHRRFMAALRDVEPLEVGGAEVLLVEDDAPEAFCAGLLRPRIYLSTGALLALDDEELRAVILHERDHQLRRDPLRILVARVLSEALFFLPLLRRLRDRYASLAELAADEAAVRRLGDRAALASALPAFGDRPRAGTVVGVAPERVDPPSGTVRALGAAGVAGRGRAGDPWRAGQRRRPHRPDERIRRRLDSGADRRRLRLGDRGGAGVACRVAGRRAAVGGLMRA